VRHSATLARLELTFGRLSMMLSLLTGVAAHRARYTASGGWVGGGVERMVEKRGG
jgi:hypothetical protein